MSKHGYYLMSIYTQPLGRCNRKQPTSDRGTALDESWLCVCDAITPGRCGGCDEGTKAAVLCRVQPVWHGVRGMSIRYVF